MSRLSVLVLGPLVQQAAVLSHAGMQVVCTQQPLEALQHAADACPDAVVIRVAQRAHLDLIRDWRRTHRELLILAVVSAGLTAVRKALDAGASDFLAHPADGTAILARLDMHARRRRSSQQLRLGARTVDLESHRVMDGMGGHTGLTALEAQFLAHLAAHTGRTVPVGELLRAVWGHGRAIKTRAVTHLVSRLRHKIEVDAAHPRFLKTVRGQGFRLDLAFEDPDTADRPILGREALMQAILDALPSQPVVLHGPAGIGKTRVALEIVKRLMLPTLRLQLEDLRTAPEQRRLIATYLGAAEAPDALVDLSEHVGGLGPTCLWLDGLNHGATTLMEGMRQLAAHCPELRILATSQVDADMPGVARIRLQPLRPAHAVELLVHEARRLGITIDAPSIHRHARGIVERLDCMPLSIRLAAQELRHLDPAELYARIDRNLTAGQTAPGFDDPQLQAQLERAISALPELDRQLLWVLARFEGPVGLRVLAGALTDASTRRAQAIVARLQSRSLIEVLDGDLRRYRVLGMVRVHIFARADASAFPRWLAAADALLDQAEAQVAALDGPDPALALDRLRGTSLALRAICRETRGRREGRALLVLGALTAPSATHIEALRAARARCTGGLADDLALQEARTLVYHLRGEEALAALTQIEAPDSRFALVEAEALKRLARHDAAEDTLRTGLQRASAVDDRIARVRLLGRLAAIYRRTGRHADARIALQRAVDGATREQAVRDIVRVQHETAVLSYEQGRMADARDAFKAAERGFKALGQPIFAARARINRAAALSMLGQHELAEQLLVLGHARLRAHTPRLGDANAALILARLRIDQSDFIAAHAALDDALDATAKVMPRTVGFCWLWRGIARALEDAPDAADHAYHTAGTLARSHGLSRLGALVDYFASLSGGTQPRVEMPWYPALAAALNALRDMGAAAADAHADVLARSLEARAALRLVGTERA